MREGLRAVWQEPYFDYAVESALAGYGPTTGDRAQLLIRRIDAIVS